MTATSRSEPRCAALLATVAGSAAMLIGLATLIGWFFGWPALVQWWPTFPLMAGFTAIALGLNGLGLVVHAVGGPRMVSVISGGLAALLGAAWCAEHLLGWPLGLAAWESCLPRIEGLPAIRTSPAAMASLGLLGIAISAGGWPLPGVVRRRIRWTAESLAIAPFVMVVGAYLAGFWTLEDLESPHGLAVNTLVGLIALGLGVLALQAMDGTPLIDDPYLPVPLMVVLASSAFIFWAALEAEHDSALENKADGLAQALAVESLAHLNPSLRALERMKLRWEQEGGTPQEDWNADADAHLDREKNFELLQRTDAQGQIIWSRPEASARQWIGRNAWLDSRWQAAPALSEGFQKRSLVVSEVFPVEDEPVIVAYFPLFPKAGFDGWMLGTLPLTDLTQTLFRNARLANARVAIYADNRLIAGRPARSTDDELTGDAQVDFFGHHWRFVVAIRPDSVAGHHLPLVTLVFGLLLALSSGLAVRAYQIAVWRSRELHAANLQLERLANEDYLTGLLNRRHFDEVLSREIERARRNRRRVSVIMADVDYFKRYNDHYGHPAGDECLRRVAAVFKAGARITDSIGRYGGEEFCAVLPDTDLPGAWELAERSRAALQALGMPHELNPVQCVTASIGVSCLDFSQTQPADAGRALVAAADAALYAAKEAGRNRVA